MKRVCRLLILLFVIVLFGTQITVFAESKDVVVGSSDAPVYSLDVTWGKMQFVYNKVKTYEWSNVTHEYDVRTQYSWTSDGNVIKVKNNSIFDVKTNCTYASTFGNLKGNFSKNDFKIASSKSDEVTFTLSGSLSKDVTKFTKVGTLTLKFS